MPGNQSGIWPPCHAEAHHCAVGHLRRPFWHRAADADADAVSRRQLLQGSAGVLQRCAGSSCSLVTTLVRAVLHVLPRVHV